MTRIITFLVLFILLIGGGYFAYTKYSKTGTPLLNYSQEVTIKGSLNEIHEDLDLVKTLTDEEMITVRDSEELNRKTALENGSQPSLPLNPKPNAIYYDAGEFVGGKYNGFKRILMLTTSQSQIGYSNYLLATKDFKTYILDGDPEDATNNEWNLNQINRQKVTSVETLPSSHPVMIPLSKQFALHKGYMALATLERSTSTGYDPNFLPIRPILDTSKFTQLDFHSNDLKIYTEKQELNTYTAGNLETFVADKTGLIYKYNFSLPERITKYEEDLANYNKHYQEHTQIYPRTANMYIEKKDMITTFPVYDDYDLALPQSCAANRNTLLVKNISDSELTKIGTFQNIDLYTLKDKDHPLNKLAYLHKITKTENELFIEINKRQKPTLEEYVSKAPLIFFKDQWGRWAMNGEYDFGITGGCGKPVIYLYPTQPTQVSVSLTGGYNFTKTVPTYHQGWNVLANPDGQLVDLQPQYTNCSEISKGLRGLEYAKNACLNNKYPYLYWSGQSYNTSYPLPENGWIVERNELAGFLDQKLTQVGLSNVEKKEMISYWLPEMIDKNTPFYKISFLQTPQMNQIAPMQITPKPDTLFRIFLDYTPLQSKPSILPSPQSLQILQRTGFTVVEWGGKHY